ARVAGAPVADREVGEEERVEQASGRGLVVLREGIVELHGRARDEVEDRGRVDGHADRLVRGRVDLGRRQPTEVGEALAEPAAAPRPQLRLLTRVPRV